MIGLGRPIAGTLRSSILGCLVIFVFLCISAASALAEPECLSSTCRSWWHLTSAAQPTDLPPGGEGTIAVVASNLGDVPIDPEAYPVTVTDRLPEGLVATAISGAAGRAGRRGFAACLPLPALSCTFAGARVLYPYEQLEIRITVKVEGARSGASNEADITGGAARPESVTRPIVVSSAPATFGFEQAELLPENESGLPDAQAGSHPFQLTASFVLNQNLSSGCTPSTITPGVFETCLEPAALPKDLGFALPPGLVGNPNVVPQCTEAQFAALSSGGFNECPADTAVGVAGVTIRLQYLEYTTVVVPIFNLVPAPGEPARFGFVAENVPVTLDTAVRTGHGYSVVVTSHDTTELPDTLAARTTFWGVPGDSRHDNARGWSCIRGERFVVESGVPCVAQDESKPPAFLVLPTSCSGPLQTVAEGDSWREPSNVLTSSPPMESLDGCDKVSFGAGIEAAPDVQESSTPTGLKVDVHVPQDSSLDAEGVGGSDVKDISVTLPEGVTLNPAGADGLEACSEGLVGFEGAEPGGGTDLFSPTDGSPFCPDASKVATAKITTPLLTHPIEGSVYLASQNANPFGSLVAMYLVARDPVSGVLVKLPGEVSLNQATGQITATFLNNPQLPFEDAELHFFGGDRAPLSTPAHCGSYATDATFTPWSGNATVSSSSTFNITSGPNGGPCPGAALPFSPSLTAGNTSNNAGGFSPFTLTMSREDGQQNLKAVSLQMPPGLSGILTGIPLCAEAQADAGTCATGSLIGETTVSVGLGSNPYTVTGGKVYLTGPYEGAPFGLSIVNPANAGPFHLGNVIVRAKIEVNPLTAALTVTSDSSGPYAIPPSIQGIPLQIKHVNVTINRSGFTFNPTNCNAQSLSGTLTSIEGATATLPVPFQSTNCTALKFAPKFSVSTSGETSKAKGASLTAKLSEPAGSMGTQANITRAKFDLPKQLPSRLTTLQKACTNKQFELNPANCPKESKIGYAVVHTPLLPVPLEGPAIFVSHGGEAFPSLTMVLQGYGVTVDLVGTTFISKKGITSTTFKTVPDVPFNAFQLTLPEGKFSALAANGNLCKSKLAMPTEFLAQNGAKINESTKVSVASCPKAKKTKKKSKKSSKRQVRKGKRK
jgi:hypothetical protein